MKIYNKLIINASNVVLPKKPNVIKLRIIGDDNFKIFCDLLKIKEDSIKKKEDGGGPFTREECINIKNYSGPEYGYITAKWYVVDLIFGSITDKEFFNKCMVEYDEMFVGDKCKSLWFPKRPVLKKNNEYWDTKKKIINKYKIYCITKGRYEKQTTRKYLEEMGADYYLVVETAEVQKYIDNGCPKEKILEFTPEAKKDITHTCQKWIDGGSIPVRNFIWEHSINQGQLRHWCLDDNLDGFHRLYKNARVPIKSPVVFRAVEDYADNCKNLYMCGLNYSSMVPEISRRRSLTTNNTRIYSCILIHNSLDNAIIKHTKDKTETEYWTNRWRGAYNEDTDLSLRLLKCGLPTILFNNLLCNKMTTNSCKGGNTDSIYKGDGLQKKLEQLLLFHGDVAKQSNKFKKENHHQVDYSGFKENKVIFNDKIKTYNYNMISKLDTEKIVKKINKKKVLTKPQVVAVEPVAEDQPEPELELEIEEQPEPEPEKDISIDKPIIKTKYKKMNTGSLQDPKTILEQFLELKEQMKAQLDFNKVDKSYLYIQNQGLNEAEKKELIIKLLS
tara:strand:+ start:1367 stop:3040 length:1674 start_codon:yes stop_codon:yes gene_type:complete